MKIVIELSEKDIEKIKNAHRGFFLDLYVIMGNAINAGTRLPKGHGRLIDYEYVIDAVNDWINAEEYKYTNATGYLRKRIKNAPTIIEAENEVGE